MSKMIYMYVSLAVGNKYWLTKKHTSLVSMQRSPFMKKVYTVSTRYLYKDLYILSGWRASRLIKITALFKCRVYSQNVTRQRTSLFKRSKKLTLQQRSTANFDFALGKKSQTTRVIVNWIELNCMAFIFMVQNSRIRSA